MGGAEDVDEERRGDPPGRSWPARAQRPRTGAVVVGLLAVLRGLLVLVQGAQLLQEDYIYVYGRRVNGLLHTSADFRLLNRPGAWLSQTLLFGIADDSPVVLLVLVTALNVVAAVALYYAVGRFFPAPAPLLVAGLWVLLPNHSTFTVWPTAAQGVVALALAFGGVTLLTKGRWPWALALFSASLLFYELEVATVFVASVVVGTRLAQPLEPIAPERRIRVWHRVVMVVVLFAVTRWMARNPTFPLEVGSPDALTTWSGHVAYGITSTATGSAILLRALEYGAAAGVVVCAFAWFYGDRARDRGPSLAVAGVAVMALGLALVIAVPGGLLGVSNRLYGASSVGTAMIFVGIGQLVWHRVRWLSVAGAVTLVGLCAVGQVVATRSAVQAGDDAAALIDHLRTETEDPANTRFLVEPPPDRNGFVGIDHLFDLYPYKLAFDQGVGELRVAATQAEFEHPAPDEVQITWAEVLG